MAQESDNPLKGWHFRKEFHAGHIVTTVAMIIAATMAWSDLRSSNIEHERRILAMERRLEGDDSRERLARIEALLEALNSRLDRMDRQE